MTAAAKDRLVFFVTDRGYLLPSVVAALQVAEQPRVTAIADVAVYLVGLGAEEVAALAAAFAGTGIALRAIDDRRLRLGEDIHFNDTHVSPAALGRLVVAAAIPAQYEHLVYIDGDVQVTGDLQPLVAHDVREGAILAAPDSTTLLTKPSGSFAEDNRRYLDGLGVGKLSDYFNSGVMAFRRTTWQRLSEKAMRFFEANSRLCRYHDQSAVNAVVEAREHLHPAFNFMPAYRRAGVSRIGAAITHFIGPRKPWHPNSGLWDPAFGRSYADALAAYPILRDYPPPAPHRDAATAATAAPPTSLRGRLQAFAKRRRLDRYLARTDFAVRPAGRAR